MIEISNLSFGYGRKELLFRNLSLKVLPGRISGLLGKNGAGKTTLLKIVCGLLFPQKGESKVLGIDSRLRRPGVLGEIFFIPEEFYLPPVTPNEYVKAFSTFYERFKETEFRESLSVFEIPVSAKLTSMSYGQKKKFLLAFGLATGSKILLLDEPTNGLDIPSKSQFRRALASAVTDDRVILVSTHQVRDMENLIDSVVILDDGEIIFQQDMEKILRRFSVRLVADPVDVKGAIYYEKVPGGYVVLTDDKDGGDTKIDLELFFNAVVKNKERFYKMFSEGGVLYES